jgi:hypothetical protein
MKRIEAGRRNAKERIHPEQGRKNQDSTVAILDIGGMNNRVERQPSVSTRIWRFLPLFARIIAIRINAGSPFSALFTLWLSMMAAVGLARLATGTPHKARGCDPAAVAHKSRSSKSVLRGGRSFGIARHWVSRTHMIPFITSRPSTRRLLPPRLAGGINGSTYAHSSSVKQFAAVVSLHIIDLLESSHPS